MYPNPIFIEQMARDRAADYQALIDAASAIPLEVRWRRSQARRRILLAAAVIVLVAGSFVLWLS